ncbi:DUF1772 domain-containing protein [Streptomyces sp. NBC_01142]|uniref:anthrone oxygenase family protein n=1 Tax=Streptomyces sp. NBC_01142 TaxID=2975865 RepID=UPI0022566109|nr:DUF1772 domain-containing protein [Streptomyces sp. NBC_01142]MCX4823173.1 DUF1772 domain-containing protein [Streptomyces sp. NBC_01142]
MATLLLALAVVCNGLYAGFMLIFQTGIMPALARLSDDQFVASMRRINESVPRAVFLLVFVGLVAFPAVALAVPVDDRSDSQLWLIVAGLVCGVLNHLITIGGNVPLNNALASSESASPPIPDSEVRAAFESRWNQLHLVRTVLIVAAFALLVAASLA